MGDEKYRREYLSGATSGMPDSLPADEVEQENALVNAYIRGRRDDRAQRHACIKCYVCEACRMAERKR